MLDVLSALQSNARAPLSTWIHAHAAAIQARVQQATTPPEVQEVLDYVFKSLAHAINARISGHERFDSPMEINVYRRSLGRGWTVKGMEGAKDVLRAQGWGLAVRPMRGSMNKDEVWSLTVSERVAEETRRAKAEAAERQITELASAAALPFHDQVGLSLLPLVQKLKHGIVHPVAGETWVVPAHSNGPKSDIAPDGAVAYRLPKGTRGIPEHFPRRKPPDWIKALLSKEWAAYPEFVVHGYSAYDLCAPAAADDTSRYGITGVLWSPRNGGELAATDGNQLHTVHVGVVPPERVTALDPRCRGGLVSTRPVEGGFNLSPTIAVGVGSFPDYPQVMPIYGRGFVRLRWTVADAKAYKKALAAIPKRNLYVTMPWITWSPDGWYFVTQPKDGGAVERGASMTLGTSEIRDTRSTVPVAFSCEYFTTMINSFLKLGLPFEGELTGALSPAPFRQLGADHAVLQEHILMPTRRD